MQNKKFYAVFPILAMLAGIFIIPSAIPSLLSKVRLEAFGLPSYRADDNVTITSSGNIAIISPLHVEGRYIKDIFNNTVLLRGVWKGGFADSCVGLWNGLTWDENAVRAHMQTLKENWGINVINDFILGDWWLEDKSTSYHGTPTSHSYRFAIKETLRIAQECGLYFQIRLYCPIQEEGRVKAPYQPYSNWTVDDFVNFWVDVATELKDCPNVIFTLYDEPTGDINVWFDAAERAINAIRAVGAEQLIVVHWAYCGSCMWMEQWVNEGRPLHNIVFSNHIYRYHETFEYNRNSPVDIDYIRNFLANNSSNGYTGAAYKYVTDTYNIPIWVSAIGAYAGYTNDKEYVYFRNTLSVLNEWELSYAAYHCYTTHLVWTLLGERTAANPPNRVGQALIDAIAGIPAPPTHQLTVSSNPPAVQFALNGFTRGTPYGPTTLFEGNYTIAMPSSITTYSHTPLFGNTKIGTTGGSYPINMITAGPYELDENVTISAINLYTVAAGKARVTIYDATTYPIEPYPPEHPHPNDLIVESAEKVCEANSWNTFNIPTTQLQPGTYFIAIKTNTNGMLTGTSKTWFGQYRSHDHALPFPDPFGTIDGGTGTEISVYIPLAPIQTSTYYFAHWEDDSTNPERTINLTTNMTLTATYELTTGG